MFTTATTNVGSILRMIFSPAAGQRAACRSRHAQTTDGMGCPYWQSNKTSNSLIKTMSHPARSGHVVTVSPHGALASAPLCRSPVFAARAVHLRKRPCDLVSVAWQDVWTWNSLSQGDPSTKVGQIIGCRGQYRTGGNHVHRIPMSFSPPLPPPLFSLPAAHPFSGLLFLNRFISFCRAPPANRVLRRNNIEEC